MCAAMERKGEAELKDRTTNRLAGFIFVVGKLQLPKFARSALLAEAAEIWGEDMMLEATARLGLEDLGREACLASLQQVVDRLENEGVVGAEAAELFKRRFEGH